MSDPSPTPATPITPADAEAGWPPRFTNAFVGWSALLLLLLFGSVAAWFRDVFGAAKLFETEDPAGNVGAYVLFITGLLSLFVAAWFGIVEAKKPPPPSERQPGNIHLDAAPNPGGLIGPVIDKFADRKMSRVLLAIAFVLFVLGAAGTGMIDISIGDDNKSESDAADQGEERGVDESERDETSGGD